MTLEKKKKHLELRRVETARMELEFKIEERIEEIKRLEQAIEIQKQTEEKLKSELS